MKKILIIPVFLILSACDMNDILITAMEASYVEQFASVCDQNNECILVTEEYSSECFDKNLALDAIKADGAPKKMEINTGHIIKFGTCLAEKANQDYWKDIDMADYILSQLNE